MQEKLDEIQRDLDAMYEHLDAITDLVKSAYATRSFPVMRVTYELMKEESRELTQAANEVNRKFENLQEKNRMKRISLLVLSLVLLFTISSFVVAQDTPLATNTPFVVEGTATVVSSEPLATVLPGGPIIIDLPEGTDQSPVVIVNPAPSNPVPATPANEPSDRTLLVIGTLLFLAYQLIRDFLSGKRESALADRLAQAHKNTAIIDEARQRYMESSVSTQEVVKLLQAVSGVVGSLNLPLIDPSVDEAHSILNDIINPPSAPGTAPVQTKPLDGDPYLGNFPDQYPIDKQT